MPWESVWRCGRSTRAAVSKWEVTRIGADIGIRCVTCSRQVMMARSMLEKRMKARLSGERAT